MTILHFEDDPEAVEKVRALIRREWPDSNLLRFSVHANVTPLAHHPKADVIIADFRPEEPDGPDVLRLIRTPDHGPPFIFFASGGGSERSASAIRAGADDFIPKDKIEELVPAIRRALAKKAGGAAGATAGSAPTALEVLLDRSHEMIVVMNLAGTVISWNPVAETLLGWTTAEAVGRDCGILFGAKAVLPLDQARIFAERQVDWNGIVELVHRTGAPRFADVRLTQIPLGGNRGRGILCIAQDITTQRSIESQFLRAQRMETIGLLAAGIAHDLNNMLSPVLLATPMLRSGATDPAINGMLTTIEKSAERGASLIRQILAFAHGAGDERRLLQVKHLLRDITSIVKGTFPKNIRLEEFIPNHLWPVHGNPTQLHQVLLNLCVNARDAMPAGGMIRLRAENRVLGSAATSLIPGSRPGPFLVLQIEDTGTGIRPDVLDRMWEPFFTTKESGKGTGLGLSTARTIVENHLGFMSVSSAPGCGASFCIFLPAAEGLVTDLPNPPAHVFPAGKGELILVVDDEPNIRNLARVVLTRAGFQVLLAADGADAEALIAGSELKIHLVISDLHMPNLDGMALVRAIRRGSSQTKIILISGMPGRTDAGLAGNFAVEADAFLPKPFKPGALLEKVHRLLNPAVSDRPSAPASVNPNADEQL